MYSVLNGVLCKILSMFVHKYLTTIYSNRAIAVLLDVICYNLYRAIAVLLDVVCYNLYRAIAVLLDVICYNLYRAIAVLLEQCNMLQFI